LSEDKSIGGRQCHRSGRCHLVRMAKCRKASSCGRKAVGRGRCQMRQQSVDNGLYVVLVDLPSVAAKDHLHAP
jgi:hypothetical protein